MSTGCFEFGCIWDGGSPKGAWVCVSVCVCATVNHSDLTLHGCDLTISQRPTDVNADSSRSHLIVTLIARSRPKSGPGTVTQSRLHLVDLAGSESHKVCAVFASIYANTFMHMDMLSTYTFIIETTFNIQPPAVGQHCKGWAE